MENNDLRTQVKKLVDAGIPEKEIGAFIQRHQNPQAVGPGYEYAELRQEYPIRRKISNAFRILAEGVGITAGSVAGAPGGPAPSVAWAGVGYSIMSNVSDRLHEALGLSEGMDLQESTIKAISDVAKGMTYEMGGQSAGVVLGVAANSFKRVLDWTKRTFGISDKAALRKAEDVYKNLALESPDALKSAEETDALLKRMEVRTKPTVAQRTNSREAAMLEQNLATDKGFAAELTNRRDAIRGEAQFGLAKKFGKGSADDIKAGVSSQQAKLASRAEAARVDFESAINPILSSPEKQVTGEGLYSNLKEAKAAAKRVVDTEYSKIPEGIELSSQPVTKSIKKVAEDIKLKGGGSSTYPSAIVKQIRQKTKNETVTFDQLRDWKSQIGEEVRDNISGANPNLKVVRRLKMIEDGVDEAMDQMLKGENADVVNQYKIATETFKKFHRTFRKGTVGDVLQPGNLSTGQKVGMTDIPAKFFSNADKADDLVNAIGKEKAAAFMDDYVGFTLANQSTHNSKKMVAWVQKNRSMLDKFGLKEKYLNIAKTMEISEKTLSELNAYNKTVASSILDSDVDKVIRSVFSKRSAKMGSASSMNDLLNLPGIKDNKSAIEGIKTAFKDFILAESKSTSAASESMKNPVHLVNTLGKKMDEYMPAMNVLYRGELDKIKALKDYHKVLSILERNMNVTAAGGSTTAEKLSASEAKRSIAENIIQVAAVMKGSGWFVSSVKNLVKAVAKMPQSVTKEKTNQILMEAMLNPDLAQTLLSGGKGKAFQTRLNNHLITLGITETHNMMGDDDRD